MKKVLRSKTWSGIALGFVLLMLIGLFVLGARFCIRGDFMVEQTTFLEGEYSVDGGDWKPIDNEKEIGVRFRKAVFRGKIPHFAFDFKENINISSKNVWYSLKTADGMPIDEYSHTEREYLDEHNEPYLFFAANMPNTPRLPRQNAVHRSYGGAGGNSGYGVSARDRKPLQGVAAQRIRLLRRHIQHRKRRVSSIFL